jgi:Uma2 family endonuclease
MALTELPKPGERLKMTYEEFLAWADEDIHAEWVNGEVIIHMTAKERHQEIVRFLLELFGLFNQFFRAGRFFMAPYQMKLGPEGPGREPDILFVARAHESRVTERGVAGPADLVIEVVSDDSVTRDRVEKFEEYEEYGVQEYWIIDPRPKRPRAEFYQLDERGQYQPVPVGPDGVYRSKILSGFWLRVDWLWAETLPDSLFAFAEIANLPAEVVQTLRRLQRP